MFHPRNFAAFYNHTFRNEGTTIIEVKRSESIRQTNFVSRAEDISRNEVKWIDGRKEITKEGQQAKPKEPEILQFSRMFDLSLIHI